MEADPFRDRVAVITGGAGGIGMALARAFAARGAILVLATGLGLAVYLLYGGRSEPAPDADSTEPRAA